MNSHRFELYRAYSIFGQFVKSCQIFLKYQSSGKENESTSSTKLSRCSRAVAAMNVQKAWCTSKGFVLPVCWFLPFSLLSSLSLLKPPILYCLLGYWHLIWTVRMLAKTQNTVNSSLFNFLWNHRQQYVCQKSLTKAALRLYSVRESIWALKWT